MYDWLGLFNAFVAGMALSGAIYQIVFEKYGMAILLFVMFLLNVFMVFIP